MPYSTDTEATILLVIFIVALLILSIFAFYTNVIVPFIKERKYIVLELERTEGREYRYWQRELKKLYVSHIPIIGKLLAKKYR